MQSCAGGKLPVSLKATEIKQLEDNKMKKTVSHSLFFAVCLILVGTGFGDYFVGNSQFEDVPLESGDWTYAILPWFCDNITGN